MGDATLLLFWKAAVRSASFELPLWAECANLRTPRARAVTRGGRSTRRAQSRPSCCLQRMQAQQELTAHCRRSTLARRHSATSSDRTLVPSAARSAEKRPLRGTKLPTQLVLFERCARYQTSQARVSNKKRNWKASKSGSQMAVTHLATARPSIVDQRSPQAVTSVSRTSSAGNVILDQKDRRVRSVVAVRQSKGRIHSP